MDIYFFISLPYHILALPLSHPPDMRVLVWIFLYHAISYHAPMIISHVHISCFIDPIWSMPLLHLYTRYSISALGELLIKQCLTVRLPLWTMITPVSSSSVGMHRCCLYISHILMTWRTYMFFFWHCYWNNMCRDVFTQLVWTLVQEHYPVRIAIEVAADANLQSQLCSTEVSPCLLVDLSCWHVLKMEVCLSSGLVSWICLKTF